METLNARWSRGSPSHARRAARSPGAQATPQVSVPLSLVLDATLEPSDRLVWVVVDQLPAPREREIAAFLGLSLRTVARSIRRLERAGWLIVAERCVERGNRYVARHATPDRLSGREASALARWQAAQGRDQTPPPDPAYFDSPDYRQYLKELCSKSRSH